MEESEHITPCGSLIVRCDGKKFTLVDIDTGVIVHIGADPLDVMSLNSDPMDREHRVMFHNYVDNHVEDVFRIFILEDNGYEF